MVKRSVLLLVLAVAVLSVATSVRVADACLLAERLRVIAPYLSEEEVMGLAHGTMQPKRIPYLFTGSFPCVNGMADIFPCDGVDLLGFFTTTELTTDGSDPSGNDMWGWTDPVTGKNYALVGLSNGVSAVDVTDPKNAVFVAHMPAHNGLSGPWRDVKVYQDHAFIVADNAGPHGMQVFDLTDLRTVVSPPVNLAPVHHYTGVNEAHNIALNTDSGFAYLVGSETCSGGLHMVDVRNPTAPINAGCFSQDGYTHDVQCVDYVGPDVQHQGKEICFASNEDSLTIVDVTNKNSPVQISRTEYPNSGYTHQGWLTEDQTFFVHDDELDEINHGHNTRTYSWDVSNLDQPTLSGFWDAAGSSVDHNQYIKDAFTYQANYTRGLRILKLDDPGSAAFTEVAFFDTYPNQSGTFSGAWSTYPFFDDIVLVSDINRGLFILQPTVGTTTEIFGDGFNSGDTSVWSETFINVPEE